ncbi:MAG: excinuclease ABC subunit UvrC [Actinobacteria bacterium HGW-Actinobacteria-1]|jgi:excinuclease ABC subunit C|nr:MAG: excinuclease ABC subunit UvrC [Actinobacteria bacterium HGW-Actinobacteria-1]
MTLDASGASLPGVPDSPGVYLWKGAGGEVLYVGKAKSLRKRMRQYVSGHDDREKIPMMMEHVASYDYVVTDNEVESLILEANLIKQFDPPFNVDYRDGKTYPYIALTTGDPFPAIKYTRERHRPGTRYFGPYTDARGARETIEVVRRVYPICRATCVEWKRLTAKGGEPTGKPCFDYHVGKGPGPCVGAITPEEYAERVNDVSAFLEGRRGGIASDLERAMRAASADLDYERAARLRNSLDAVRSVLEKQKVVSDRPLDMDVIGVEREETIAGVHVFLVREGRVLAGNEFVLDKGLDVPESELIEGFLLRYYGETSYVPKEIIVPMLPEEPEVAEEWLSRLRGTRARLSVPQRGEKRALSELACTNARHTLARYKHRTRYDEERLNRALLELESALALPAPPLRIECYDISTLHGRFSVGSMVVFSGGRADRASYRRFKVRLDSAEANDFAMMQEVLSRRFARDAAGDSRFGSRPDLIVIDGGKPQLTAATAVAAELGITVPIVSLAKREEELYVPEWEEPVTLPAGSSSLYLVKRLRDEAHRFAIEYHRTIRDKAMTVSALDDIPGVGPKRRKALIKAFGSVRKLRSATAEEIAAVPGIPAELARDIVRFVSPLAEEDASASE